MDYVIGLAAVLLAIAASTAAAVISAVEGARTVTSQLPLSGSARADAMTENRGPDSLHANIWQLVHDLGLKGFSQPDSRLTESGWVDWVIQGRRGTLFRELKSEDGELTPQQRLVGDRLRRHGCDWAVWRPRDLLTGGIRAELEAIL